MNWRKAKLLREHLIMDTEEDRDRERINPLTGECRPFKQQFEQALRPPLSTGNEPERDPEIIAKRVAEMQQMTNPPFRGNLTILWETEKAELHQRIEALEADVRFLKADIKVILHAQSRYLAQGQQERGVSGTGKIPEADYEGAQERQRPLK